MGRTARGHSVCHQEIVQPRRARKATSAEAIAASIAPTDKISAAVALVLAVLATSTKEATTASWALGAAFICATCSALTANTL
jgi:hypothetical protein